MFLLGDLEEVIFVWRSLRSLEFDGFSSFNCFEKGTVADALEWTLPGDFLLFEDAYLSLTQTALNFLRRIIFRNLEQKRFLPMKRQILRLPALSPLSIILIDKIRQKFMRHWLSLMFKSFLPLIMQFLIDFFLVDLCSDIGIPHLDSWG